PGIDAVGLAGQRSKPLDLLGVGDLDLPARQLELVVDEAGAVHRLDRGADWLSVAIQPSREPSEAVPVRRRGTDLDGVPVLGERVKVEPLAAKVKSNVQH